MFFVTVIQRTHYEKVTVLLTLILIQDKRFRKMVALHISCIKLMSASIQS